jgi:putative acetyltransferase
MNPEQAFLQAIVAHPDDAPSTVLVTMPSAKRGSVGGRVQEEAIMVIRPEEEMDYHAIWNVNRLAFGGQTEEAKLVDDLRAEGYKRLSLVAEDDGTIVGHVLFSDLAIETRDAVVDALALAPLAVAPSHQGQGIGSALVREGLRLCAEQGHRIVVVVGHPAYYRRFGFSAQLAERLASPYAGPEFMALELVLGALDGVSGKVAYPPPFGRMG